MSIERIHACDENRKLQTFQLFKDSYCFEQYLTNVFNIRYRTVITRFRLSSHNLDIEVGRHFKPKSPVGHRICKNCNSMEVEDEQNISP